MKKRKFIECIGDKIFYVAALELCHRLSDDQRFVFRLADKLITNFNLGEGKDKRIADEKEFKIGSIYFVSGFLEAKNEAEKLLVETDVWKKNNLDNYLKDWR